MVNELKMRVFSNLVAIYKGILDNASTEAGTKEYLSSLPRKTITSPVNLGFAKATMRLSNTQPESIFSCLIMIRFQNMTGLHR